MSDGLRVDFSGVEVKEFSDLPVGTYHCKITNGEVVDNKDGPNEKNPTGQHINWEFTVQDGPLADRKTWRRTPLGGDGVGILKALLAATGKFTDEALDGPLDFKIEEVLSSDVIVVQGNAKPNPNNPPIPGEPPRTEVKRVRPYQAGAVGAGPDSILP